MHLAHENDFCCSAGLKCRYTWDSLFCCLNLIHVKLTIVYYDFILRKIMSHKMSWTLSLTLYPFEWNVTYKIIWHECANVSARELFVFFLLLRVKLRCFCKHVFISTFLFAIVINIVWISFCWTFSLFVGIIVVGAFSFVYCMCKCIEMEQTNKRTKTKKKQAK